MERKIIIRGEPVAKARPRFSTITGRAYTPNKTKFYEDKIAYTYKQAYKDLITGAIALNIDMYFKIPKSDSKQRKADKLKHIIRPTKKPDIDNVVKGILDGLNGVAFLDDVQVVELASRKFYSDEPRIEITIKQLENELN